MKQINSPVIHNSRRGLLEKWIEDAIALLDKCDGDADFEDCDDDYVDEREEPHRIMGRGWRIIFMLKTAAYQREFCHSIKTSVRNMQFPALQGV
mgnify:CR=1 FL=1